MNIIKRTNVIIALIVSMIAYSLMPGTPVISWPLSANAQEPHDHAEHADEVEDAAHEGHDHAEHADETEDAGHEGHDDHADHAGEESSGIKLSPATIREFGIETATAASGELRVELKVPGEIVPSPNYVAHVVPRAPGIVLRVRKQVGDLVKAGEILAVLDSPELSEAKAQYLARWQELELDEIDLRRAREISQNTQKALDFLKASPALGKLSDLEGLDLGDMRRDLIGSYAAMVAAETTLQRKQTLHEKNVASDAELQEAESAYKQARTEYIAARDAISYSNSNSFCVNRII